MSPWDEISEWDQWTTKCLGMRFRNETNGLLHQLKLSRFVQVAMVKHYSTLEFPSMVLEMEKDDYIITAGCDYYHHILANIDTPLALYWLLLAIAVLCKQVQESLERVGPLSSPRHSPGNLSLKLNAIHPLSK